MKTDKNQKLNPIEALNKKYFKRPFFKGYEMIQANPDLTPNQKNLLSLILSFHTDKKKFQMKYQTIASHIGCVDETVKNVVGQLKALGLIEPTQIHNANHAGSRVHIDVNMDSVTQFLEQGMIRFLSKLENGRKKTKKSKPKSTPIDVQHQETPREEKHATPAIYEPQISDKLIGMMTPVSNPKQNMGALVLSMFFDNDKEKESNSRITNKLSYKMIKNPKPNIMKEEQIKNPKPNIMKEEQKIKTMNEEQLKKEEQRREEEKLDNEAGIHYWKQPKSTNPMSFCSISQSTANKLEGTTDNEVEVTYDEPVQEEKYDSLKAFQSFPKESISLMYSYFYSKLGETTITYSAKEIKDYTGLDNGFIKDYMFYLNQINHVEKTGKNEFALSNSYKNIIKRITAHQAS